MRINKFLAQGANISRRKADEAVAQGRVEINGIIARNGDIVIDTDTVKLDGQTIVIDKSLTTIILNKPPGYVVSRRGQGSHTIYDILPERYQHLNPVGRLDKDSSGLLVLTSDGDLANQLTHPKFSKEKIYHVELSDFLSSNENLALESGVNIGDKTPSKLKVRQIDKIKPLYEVRMSEGRNRQIRRTFQAIGLKVIKLHRTEFGQYKLGNLKPADTVRVDAKIK